MILLTHLYFYQKNPPRKILDGFFITVNYLNGSSATNSSSCNSVAFYRKKRCSFSHVVNWNDFCTEVCWNCCSVIKHILFPSLRNALHGNLHRLLLVESIAANKFVTQVLRNGYS